MQAGWQGRGGSAKHQAMEHDPFIFDGDPEADEASLRRAEADVAAGRVIPHEEVAKWLRTWGTPESGPPPKSWFE